MPRAPQVIKDFEDLVTAFADSQNFGALLLSGIYSDEDRCKDMIAMTIGYIAAMWEAFPVSKDVWEQTKKVMTIG